MNIQSIRQIDNTLNHYEVVVNGVAMLVATRPGQSPEDALSDIFVPQEPTYAEKRLQEYPPIQEQLDMIYHDIDAWRAQIAAIKEKHPRFST